MKNLLELSKTARIEGVDHVTISLIELVEFLIVYPELLPSNQVRLGDLAFVLESLKEDDVFLVTDKPLNKIFLAVRYWLRHVIETSLLSTETATRIDIDINIAAKYSIRIITCEEKEIVRPSDLRDLTLIEALSRDLVVRAGDRDDKNILYNISIARKVAVEC